MLCVELSTKALANFRNFRELTAGNTKPIIGFARWCVSILFRAYARTSCSILFYVGNAISAVAGLMKSGSLSCENEMEKGCDSARVQCWWHERVKCSVRVCAMVCFFFDVFSTRTLGMFLRPVNIDCFY